MRNFLNCITWFRLDFAAKPARAEHVPMSKINVFVTSSYANFNGGHTDHQTYSAFLRDQLLDRPENLSMWLW